MEAYSLKELGLMIASEAKKDGLVLAEQTLEILAKAVYKATKQWATESAKASSNVIDDMIAPFYYNLDTFVLPQIEKIDIDGSGS